MPKAVKPRFTKLDAKSKSLPKRAANWSAVKDSKTGITWLLENPGEKNQADAETWTKGLKALGKKGWRLPTLQEFVATLDYERHNPAIDPVFRGFVNGWYRTGTVDAACPSVYAWFVYLHSGYVYRNLQSYHLCVRAVRAGQ